MKRTHAIWLISSLFLVGVVGCQENSSETAVTADSAPTSGGLESTQPPMEIEIDPPTASNPLAAGAAISPAKVKPGDTATFIVRAKTADRWHIYALEHEGIGVATNLALELPSGLETHGEWLTPEAKTYASVEPSLVYEGDLSFQQSLKIADDAASGRHEVKCKFAYQTCNESLCNPPTSIELTAVVEVE